MLILQIILYIIGSLAVILTILPLLKFGAWWIRIGDFPRLQIASVCLATAVLLSFIVFPPNAVEIVFIILLIVCVAYQLFRVLPYLPIYPKQVEKAKSANADKTIKLLIYNVLIDNQETVRLLKLVKKIKPDLILLAEPDERWLREIAELDVDYPFSVKYPLDNAYGIALFSRLRLENPQLKFIIEDDIPSIHTGVELASGDLINLFCLHPRPPIPPENNRSEERDAELIIVGRKIKEMNEPTIIAGDLNDVAWSRTTTLFQKISGLLDPRIGRGLFSSFHTHHWIVRFPLDHVFHSNHFRLVELQRLPDIGSDHFPIYIALSYEHTAVFTQEEPEATAEEEIEADQMLEEALIAIEET